MAEPEKALIDYLYLHPNVKETDDIEAHRWNALEIKDQISIDKLNRYETHISSPALSNHLSTLKTYLDVTP
ncbi:MAG: hypothetical protein U5K69_26450 [Balneolaceae bacterium]|nr:hypothetical protein [Balneolaceae bacterium]